MRTTDITDTTARPGHEEIATLLPWWVNGTLAPPVAARVAAHVSGCADCRAERRELEALLTREVPPSPVQDTDAAFASVMARIDADPRTAPRAATARGARDATDRSPDRARRESLGRRVRHRLDALRQGLLTAPTIAPGLMAGGAAIALAVVLTLGGGESPADGDGPYEVLSRTPGAEAPPALGLNVEDAFEPARVREIISAHVPAEARDAVRVVSVSPTLWRVEFGTALDPETVLGLMTALERERGIASVDVLD